jgi:hypothetical protein
MRVLIVGVNPSIMERSLDQSAGAGFDAVGVLVGRDDVLASLAGGPWDAVAIGGGVDDATRAALHGAAAEGTHVLNIVGPDTLLPRLRAIEG